MSDTSRMQTYSLESGRVAQAGSLHSGPPIPLPGLSLPAYLGGGFGVHSLALTTQLSA